MLMACRSKRELLAELDRVNADRLRLTNELAALRASTTTVAIQADLVSTRDEMIPNHYDRTDPNPTIRDIRAELANG